MRRCDVIFRERDAPFRNFKLSNMRSAGSRARSVSVLGRYRFSVVFSKVGFGFGFFNNVVLVSVTDSALAGNRR